MEHRAERVKVGFDKVSACTFCLIPAYRLRLNANG